MVRTLLVTEPNRIWAPTVQGIHDAGYIGGPDLAEGLGDAAMWWDDNGDWPDGDLLPAWPLDRQDPGVEAVLEAGYGKIVDAVYFDSARDVLEYAHGAGVDLSETGPDDWAEMAWEIVQNLGQYATWYTLSDTFIFANDLPFE